MPTVPTPPSDRRPAHRHRLLRLVGVSAAVSVLGVTAACGSSGSSEPSGAGSGSASASAGFSGRGPITVAQAKDVSGWTGKMIKAWNADHPDETVTLNELPSEADQQRQQLLRYAQVKDANVAVELIDAVWTSEFAANSWVEPLPTEQFPLEGYLPQTVQTVTYFNKVYAVPLQSGGGLFYYRKDLLDAAGLSVPTTWAEMKQACAKIKATAGNGDLDCYAGQYNKYEGLTVNVAEAINSAGGTIVSNDGKVEVDSAQAQQGLEFLTDSFKEGTIPKGAITWAEEDGRQAFQSGKLIFLRNWSYVYSLAEKTDGSSKIAGKFGVAPLPGLNGPGVSTLGGTSYAISSFATNKATAADFIRYMTTPEAQKQQMLQTSSPPPLASVYTDEDVVAKYPYMPTLLKSIENAQPRPAVVRYGDVTLAIQDAAYSALLGQTSAQAALSSLEGKLQELVK